ncbi:MAG: cyclic nucleotide-binding domain-containing protein [Prosthecobacter sp.]
MPMDDEETSAVSTAEEHFEAGDVVFEQGDAANAMFRILAGTVEMTVSTTGEERVLARFGPGDFLGDMALVSGQSRVATARARTPVIVERINDVVFEDYVLGNPDLRAAYVALLMQRIRIMDALLRLEWHKEAVAEHRTEIAVTRAGYLEALPATENAWSDCPDLRLYSAPDTPPPMVDVFIHQVPFTIGRMEFPLPTDVPPTRSLNLPDREPFQISLRHCRIERRDDGLVVVDESSERGTEVNGVMIGREYESTVASLQAGQNMIRLGGSGSHYGFILDLAL